MKKLLFILKSKFDSFTQKRIKNTNKYKATNIILAIAFPLFLTALVETIQMKSPDKFIEFLFTKPTIVLFSVIIVSVLYFAIILLVKKVYISAMIVGIAMTTLSIVERFKFNTSGNHLILTDMKMAVNVGNLTKFAYIKITFGLVFFVLLLAVYLGAVYWFNPVLKAGLKKRLASATVCFASVLTLLLSPTVALPVYSFFNVDTTATENAFKLNEKFSNNNMISFLAQTTTEFLSKKVKEPEQYSVKSVSQVLSNIPKDSNANFKKPNVITIMSEAFTDFRRFDGLNIDPSVYASWDRIRSKSFSGDAVVPAFGSFTVKTEFELQFGLPVKSLNDPNMPQRLLLNRPQTTIPSYYKTLGYNTDYVHTFARSFYSRGTVFKNYSFDNMYFDDNLQVPTEHFKTYISDKVIFNQLKKIMNSSDEPVYIHTTTMQNHQPYNDPNMSQLDYYLAGVKDMLGSLEQFLDELELSGEPTVVLFIGDHFPCFKGEESIYNKMNITGDNAGKMYVQPYFIWNNFGMDYSKAPTEKVSAFYLPYVVLDLINAPKSNLIQTITDKMKTVPIYTTSYDPNIPKDNDLDTITYDLILGQQYSDEVKNAGSSNSNNK